jgi:hypothetical protein|nr:MAG TPA: hypothetical protein [Caudoviricetes sp.]
MTKDELIHEINVCSSFHVVCHDGNMINIIAESEDTFMKFPDDVEYLKDILVNWRALQTTKNRLLSNVYALLDLVNDYVNTPVEQRNWTGAHQANLERNMKGIKDNINRFNQLAAAIGRGMGDSPASKLPQHGVIITLNNGQKLHGKRTYRSLSTGDLSSVAIDFGNFIIPTAVIQSIQKCGDGDV